MPTLMDRCCYSQWHGRIADSSEQDMGSVLTSKQIALEIKRKSVEVPSGCWEWQGALFRVGYPCVPQSYGGGRYGHRAMFAAVVAPIPAGMYVLHSCDNRKCVNPEHLHVGTHLENIKDMHAKGRQRGGSLPNEKNPSCKFSNQVIAAIRRDHAEGKRKAEIENLYGLSETHYYRIIKGESRHG